MGAGGSAMGQVNGAFRSATPNSRYVGIWAGGLRTWDEMGEADGMYGRKIGRSDGVEGEGRGSGGVGRARG